VELGMHVGVSACTFAGDAHAGHDDGSVLDRLRAHHAPRYAGFSRLTPATFDEVAATVPDGGVDLLHIDALHTDEAVRHDFSGWAPKRRGRPLALALNSLALRALLVVAVTPCNRRDPDDGSDRDDEGGRFRPGDGRGAAARLRRGFLLLRR
jgi:hypothetical protein